MTFGVDELLAQAQEGEWCHRDDQGKVEASQGEDLALTQSSRHWLLTHQRPLAPPIAGVKVLERGTWAKVKLKESLRHKKNVCKSACYEYVCYGICSKGLLQL